MAAPSFDLPALTGLISQDDLPPETLLEILADHEATACLLFNAEGVDRAAVPLLQLYYSAHLIALLLVDDLCVSLPAFVRATPTGPHYPGSSMTTSSLTRL